MENNNFEDKYESFIGLEIHAALLTKSKAFSSSKNDFNAIPNTNINEMDLGYPGVKPLVNKKMVELAYYACKIFNMKIDKKIVFDRKNYFYPDLAKGYQITQFFYPIGLNGYYEILKSDNTFKKININRIHMEEDTAKQIIEKNMIKYDFNRSGIPLIEIVTDFLSFSSSEEVILFIEQIREELNLNNICSGDMSKGDLRIDLNISVRKKGETKYNNKVEIKNLNSLRNVKTAIIKEIKEQIMTLEKGQKIKEVTKNFDENIQDSIILREKDQEYHYNFITETNIIPIVIGSEFLKQMENHKLHVLRGIKKNFIKNEVPRTQSKVIFSSVTLFELFNYYSNKYNKKEDLKKIVAFLASRFQETLKQYPTNYNKIDKESLFLIIRLFYNGKINGNEIKDILIKLLKNDKELNLIVANYEKKQIITDEQIQKALIHFISEHTDEYNKYSTNKDKLQGFLIGRLVLILKNQADPRKIKTIVEEHIKNIN